MNSAMKLFKVSVPALYGRYVKIAMKISERITELFIQVVVRTRVTRSWIAD